MPFYAVWESNKNFLMEEVSPDDLWDNASPVCSTDYSAKAIVMFTAGNLDEASKYMRRYCSWLTFKRMLPMLSIAGFISCLILYNIL